MQEKKSVPRLIQESIDKGATTVEEIHKSIANLPLKMLEGSDLLRGAAKEAKRVQDHTIGVIYDVIREVNQQVGTLASDLLAEAAARRATRAREAHVRHPAAARARKAHSAAQAPRVPKTHAVAHARKVHKTRSSAQAAKH